MADGEAWQPLTSEKEPKEFGKDIIDHSKEKGDVLVMHKHGKAFFWVYGQNKSWKKHLLWKSKLSFQ